MKCPFGNNFRVNHSDDFTEEVDLDQPERERERERKALELRENVLQHGTTVMIV